MDEITYDGILDRMKAEFQTQAGFTADDASDIGIRMKVLAGEIFSLCTGAAWLKRQAFPQTADGEALTMHGEQRGLRRKQALPAVGTLTFSRRTALAYDLAIPAGTVCSAEGDNAPRFVTLEDTVLKAKYLSVTVKAQAEQGGKDSNAAVGAVTVMITPPPGIESVTNPIPFSGGVDGETDGELRDRLVQSYAQVSNGTNAEFYRSYAMQFEEIRSVGVVPRANGIGTVALYLAARGGAASDKTVAAIQAGLQALREINVDVTVLPAAEKEVKASCYVKPKAGYTLEEISPVCQNAIRAYFQDLSVGQPAIMTHIGKMLLDTGVVKNYKFYSSSVDMAVAETEIAVPGVINVAELKTGV